MKYGSFRKKFHGHCRSCINGGLGIHFKHEDCEYWEFPEPCVSCGEVKNIVIGIKPLSRIKLLRVKDSKPQE